MNRIYHSGNAKSKTTPHLNPLPMRGEETKDGVAKEGKKIGRIAIRPYTGSKRISPFGKGGLRGILATFLFTLLLFAHAHAASITYTYDGLNRLKKADYGNGTYIEYSYDAAGNRLGLVSYSSGGGSSTTLPSVSTGSASSIATTSSTLNATVNPNGLSTTAWFQYGTTTSYGSTTSTQSIGSGSSAVSVYQSISGLTAGTTYHFRVVAQNSAGTSYGADQTFATLSGSTSSAAIGYGRASFSFGAATGGANPSDQSLTIWNNGTGTLNWSVSDNASWLSLSPSSGTDSGTVTVSADVTGLSEGTYSATITLSATGATSVDIPVTLTITNSSTMPEVLWTRQIGSPSIDYGNAIAIDSSGNSYIAGYTSDSFDGNTSSGGEDIVVVKYDSNGNKLWSRQTGTSSTERAWGIAVDQSGNAYVTGWTGGGLDGNVNAGNGLSDIFLIKYDTNGNKLWTRQLGTQYFDSAYAVAVDANGNAYVTGYTNYGLDGNTNAGSDDYFLIKYDKNGNKLWTKQFGSSSNDVAYAIAVDSSGNSYITGYTLGGLDGNANAGGKDLFLVKYDTSGNRLWTRQLGSSSDDYAYGIKVDSSGNSYVTGYTSGGLDGNTNMGGSDLFIVKYDSNGNKLWTKQNGTSSTDRAYAVTVDSTGNAYVTGYTSGGLDGNTSMGSDDFFLTKYDTNGNKAWTKQIGTSSSDYASGVAVDGNGNIYVGGYTSGSFEGNTNVGSSDLFVMKLGTVSAEIDTTAPTTAATPAGGTYTSAQSVTLTASESATIYYTTDGSIPTMSSAVYSSSLTISSSSTLKFFAVDTAGNIEAVKTEGYTISTGSTDTTAPTTTASPAGGTYTSAQTVTLTCSDGTGSGCDNIYYSTDGSSSSTSYTGQINIASSTTLKFFAVDLAGNSEAVKTESYTISTGSSDTMVPTGTISINSGATYTTSTSVTPSLSASDTVGVTGYYLSTSSSTPSSSASGWTSVTSTTSYSSSVSYTLSSGDGTKTVYVWFKDAAGNVSSTYSDSITVDGTAPSNGTLTATASSSQISLSWSGFSDSTSGLASYKLVYSTSGTPSSSCSDGTQIYSGSSTSYTHSSLSNGTTYYYRVCATDNAGNISTGAAASAKPAPIDTTPPTGTISINNGAAFTTSTNVTLTLSCADSSGCSEMQFSNDNTRWSTAEIYSTKKPWTLSSGDGTKTVYAKFKDNSGNWSSAYSDTITLNTIAADTTAPTVSASPAGGTYSSSQTVTLTCSDGTGSGCDKIYYTTDGTAPTTSSTAYVFPISITKTTTLKYFAKDKAGNSSAVSSATYTINPISAIDTTPPSDVSNLSATSKDDGSVYLSWTAPTDADLKGYNIYRDSVKINSETITKSTVTYTDTDTVSGTTYAYKVTSLDLAGNESAGATKTVTAVVQDNTPPSAPSSIKVEDAKTGGSLKVAWTANTEADLSGYKVYLGTSSGSYTNTYDAGNVTTYTIAGLSDGTKYYIAVAAYDAQRNESSKSSEDTGTPSTATETLAPPTGLMVTAGNQYLNLSWTGVSNVTGYLVYIGNTDGAYGTPARTTNTAYDFENLENGKTYYVAVSAYTSSGSDAVSAESERTTSSGTPVDNNAPSSPANLTASTGTSGSVSLKWDRAEDSDISGYTLAYKQSGSSAFSNMVSISAQWSYTVTGLTDGTTYAIYLYAYDKNGNFSDPTTTSATPTNSGTTTDLTPPSAPTLSAVPANKKVTLTITPPSDCYDTDNSNICTYNLYVYNQASEKYMPLASSVSGLTYEHSEGVENGQALTFVATAVDASGNESGYSNTASAVPNELPGDIPLEEDPPVENRVDGYDVNEMAKSFGTETGDINYNPNADLTGDGKVDGNDQMILGTNHGKKKE